MGKVVADISMSLDGFVTGPDPGPDAGLGTGGEPLHTWVFGSSDPVDAEILREATESTGAVILGRRLFDVVDGPLGWGDEMGYGAGYAATPPMFVVTHKVPEVVRLVEMFAFVTDGLEAAVRQARGAAAGKEVVVMGGAETVRQAVNAGLVDELRIHLSPIILGAGTPLFESPGQRLELVQLASRATPTATHLIYGLRTS